MKKQLITVILVGVCAVFACANNAETINKNTRSIKKELYQQSTAPTGQYFNNIDLNKYSSALVINLDGEHILTIGVKQGVYFDHDANNFAEKSAWITKGNAFLVLPKNGKVESGEQLFGNNMRFYDGFVATDGFTALKQFDVNDDGVIDVLDQVFSNLFIWQDYNQNGRVDKGELSSLKSEKILTISVKAEYEPMDMMDENENVYRLKGIITKEDNSTLSFYDTWLKQDYVDTKDQTPKVIVSSSIKKLPNLAGMGNVSSLHQTMARDSTGSMELLMQ